MSDWQYWRQTADMDEAAFKEWLKSSNDEAKAFDCVEVRVTEHEHIKGLYVFEGWPNRASSRPSARFALTDAQPRP